MLPSAGAGKVRWNDERRTTLYRNRGRQSYKGTSTCAASQVTPDQPSTTGHV
jgi:hypothetical protein